MARSGTQMAQHMKLRTNPATQRNPDGRIGLKPRFVRARAASSFLQGASSVGGEQYLVATTRGSFHSEMAYREPYTCFRRRCARHLDS